MVYLIYFKYRSELNSLLYNIFIIFKKISLKVIAKSFLNL